MDLKTAIQKITDDYQAAAGGNPTPADVVRDTRALLPTRQGCHEEIDYWELNDADLVTAYHAVIDASDAEITKALP